MKVEFFTEAEQELLEAAAYYETKLLEDSRARSLARAVVPPARMR